MNQSEIQSVRTRMSSENQKSEIARAHLLKKMLKKPLREDAGADVLRDSPCSAHVSGKLLISPARFTHRCLSLLPLICVHEHVLECVLEREFEKSLFSLPVNCMLNSTRTYSRARDPHRRQCSRSGIRPGCTRPRPCARRDYFSTVTSSAGHRGKIVPSRVHARKGTCEGRAGAAARQTRSGSDVRKSCILSARGRAIGIATGAGGGAAGREGPPQHRACHRCQ